MGMIGEGEQYRCPALAPRVPRQACCQAAQWPVAGLSNTVATFSEEWLKGSLYTKVGLLRVTWLCSSLCCFRRRFSGVSATVVKDCFG